MKVLWAAIALSAAAAPARAQTAARQEGDLWTVENPRLKVTVNPAAGTLAVRDKAAAFDWRPPETKPPVQPRFRRLRALPRGLAFEADFGATRGKPNTVAVTLTVPDDAADLAIEADMADRSAEITPFNFLDPLVLDAPRGVLAVADYSNGHLYPTDLKPFPKPWLGGDRMDMPWAGLCDLDRGTGYALILETSDDAVVRSEPVPSGGRTLAAPRVVWNPCKGRFAYPRRILYRFCRDGGYVALAKAYRAYAKDRGLIVPFSEKVRKNPNLQRLFGAPDVWGDASLRFAREARALGVEKMLIHGRSSPEDMKAINDLGYLTSEYDNYTDILPLEPGKEIDSNNDILPDHAALQANGERMKAWLTWDKKTQFMKRCPARWVPSAEKVIPKLLQTQPFLGRFIDVTTAEGLYECYDEKHPLTRVEKRQCGPALLGFVRSQGLVVGGEHGIWWGVPHLDYIEGMMSGGYYSWPAGHLLHPKSKDEEFTSPWGGKLGKWEAYEKWGLGHEGRAPLWELVFHDCVVSTWYWGDASDWLLQAAPETAARKDAFNILYGTIPLLWANREGSWHAARDVFLRTCRNTCRLHETVAGTEMLSHEFLTPDRAAQATRFSDGTRAVVNFGGKPYETELAGRRVVLPQNGFAVKGPKIEQSLVLVDGKPVTTIRQEGYLFTDAGGAELTARAMGADQIRLHAGAGRPPAFRPADVSPRWDPATTRAYVLDAGERRLRRAGFRLSGDTLVFESPAGPATIDLLCRSRSALPDLGFVEVTAPDACRQGEKLRITSLIQNEGGGEARDAEVALFAGTRKLDAGTVSLPPGARAAVTLNLDTAGLDGPRRIVVAVDPAGKIPELCEPNNEAPLAIRVTPDFSRWSRRRALRAEAGALDREDEPVVCPMDLPDADPASVRVAECDEKGEPRAMVPAQYDGELCFIMPGRTAAGAARRFLVLWNPKGSPLLPPPATLWNGADQSITAGTYRADFFNGVLGRIAALKDGAAGKPFISTLVVSSKEVGWIDEPGTVERLEVLSEGPVRTTVRVRKALKAEVACEKTYAFYPRRFDVSITLNKPAGGLYSRAYYLQPGDFASDQGARARVDGKGDGEDVYGKGKNWYAVWADDWAHSCVAISPFDHLAYWDSGSWGGIGLVTRETKNVRMSYAVRPGARDASFAEAEHRRLATPVRVTLE